MMRRGGEEQRERGAGSDTATGQQIIAAPRADSPSELGEAVANRSAHESAVETSFGASWRPRALQRPEVAPLQARLDPGLAFVNSSTPNVDTPQNPHLSVLGTPDLPHLGQLQMVQLLETPELPVHRAARENEADEEVHAWWRLNPSQRGRHDAPRTRQEEEEKRPEVAPRAYVLGEADDDTVDATLEQLSHLDLALPDLGRARNIRLQVSVGRGQGDFLSVRSGLWSWRPHRQSGMLLHTHGPPVVGRNVIFEQRIGLVTVLQGCRVMAMTEDERRWGFTLGSLDEQVYKLWERLVVEWRDDDEVVLLVSGHHEVAMRGFGLIGALLSSARKNTVQDYARGMAERSVL